MDQEVSAPVAARIIGLDRSYFWTLLQKGGLTYRTRGPRKISLIKLGELKRFAIEQNYDFNEEAAREAISRGAR